MAGLAPTAARARPPSPRSSPKKPASPERKPPSMSPPRSPRVPAPAGQASKAEQNARQLALLAPRRGRSPSESRRRDSGSSPPPSGEGRLVPAEPSGLAVWTGSQGKGSQGSKGSAKGGGKERGQAAAYADRCNGQGSPFDSAQVVSMGGKKRKSKQPRSRRTRSVRRARSGPSFWGVAASVPREDDENDRNHRRRGMASLWSDRSPRLKARRSALLGVRGSGRWPGTCVSTGTLVCSRFACPGA